MSASTNVNTVHEEGPMRRQNDQVLVLLEEVARLNKELSTENRALRENLAKRDEENRKILENLGRKLDQVASGSNNGSSMDRRSKGKSRRGRVPVPAQCRRIVKQIYKTLCKQDDFQGFVVMESVHSNNNRTVIETVINELHRQYQGEEKTPWCRLFIETVLGRYFISLYEKEKQIRDGKYETHKKNCRKIGRKRDKLTKRTLALEKINWTVKKRGRVAEVLLEEAMSSEESCVEGDANGNSKVVGYSIRRLQWESSRFKKSKEDLDKTYNQNQTKRAKDRVLPRHENPSLSTRTAPDNFPDWALRT